MSTTPRQSFNTESLPFKVPVTLYTDMDRDLIKSVLRFSKVMSTPLEDGPGHKAYRTKVLKGIIESVSKIDSPDTESVTESLKGVLNPSKVTSTVNVDSEFDSLMEGLSSTEDTDTDSPSTEDTE